MNDIALSSSAIDEESLLQNEYLEREYTSDPED